VLFTFPLSPTANGFASIIPSLFTSVKSASVTSKQASLSASNSKKFNKLSASVSAIV